MPLCSFCSGLDFAHISQANFSQLFRRQTGRNLFYYIARDATLRHPRNIFTPYHTSIESLHASARLWDLCRLVQGSVDASIRKMGITELRSGYELWIGGRDRFDGFQVLGFDTKQVTERLMCHLLGGFGFCLENG